MQIEINFSHRCSSVAEFTTLSARIAALMSEFSAGPSVPVVAADPVLRPAANPVPPAPTVAHEPAAPMAADGPAETELPAAFAGALDEPKKRTRRTKEQMAADEAAKAARTAAPAPVTIASPAPATAPAVTAAPAAVDVFGDPITPAKPAPVALPINPHHRLKSMALDLIDLPGGEAKLAAIVAKFGKLADITDDKLGAAAVELNSAIRGT